MTALIIMGWVLFAITAASCASGWFMFIVLALPGRDRHFSWTILALAVFSTALAAFQWFQLQEVPRG